MGREETAFATSSLRSDSKLPPPLQRAGDSPRGESCAYSGSSLRGLEPVCDDRADEQQTTCRRALEIGVVSITRYLDSRARVGDRVPVDSQG